MTMRYADKDSWNDLRRVQDEITRWATEQFPHRTDHHAIYKLVVEEIPELAVHKKEKGTEEIGLELADCFILLLDLASLWEVDVASAIAEKMGINYNREWKQDNNGIMQHLVTPKPDALPCPYCMSSKDTRVLTTLQRARIVNALPSDDAVCHACMRTFDSKDLVDCPF